MSNLNQIFNIKFRHKEKKDSKDLLEYVIKHANETISCSAIAIFFLLLAKSHYENLLFIC